MKSIIESSPPPRKPTSIRRIVSLMLAFGLILIIGGHFLWSVIAGYSLDRALARLHASGEPTVPADLHLTDVPDGHNASLDYKSAGELIQENSAAWKKYGDASAEEFTFPLIEPEQATAHAIIDENSGSLSRIAQARGKIPGGWKDDFSHPTFLLDIKLNGAREVARLIKLDAIFSQQNHRDDRAAQSLQDGLLLANAAEMRPSLVAHLVAIGIDALASSDAASLACNFKIGTNALERSQVTALLKMLQDESPVNQGTRLGYQSERMMVVGTLKDFGDGKLSLFAMGNSGTPSSTVFSYIFRPTFRDDARLCLAFYQDVIADSAAPNLIIARQNYPSWLKKKTEKKFTMHLGASMLISSMEKSIAVSFHVKTQRRLACVAMACRLYAADHNDQLPDSLADLVPAYLPAIPIDLVSGKPLLFKSNPPRVYGVGEDNVDHGGVPIDPSVPLRLKPVGDVVVYLTPHPRGYPFEKTPPDPATRPARIP